MFSQQAIKQAKQVYLKADNSPAGKKAKREAESFLDQWIDHLRDFANLNRKTKTADLCHSTANDISTFLFEN
jgi:hypothetical protein